MSANFVRLCCQNTFSYYSDIRKYAPNPPRALTASLGREVEKFDQLCDAIEAHLVCTVVTAY